MVIYMCVCVTLVILIVIDKISSSVLQCQSYILWNYTYKHIQTHVRTFASSQKVHCILCRSSGPFELCDSRTSRNIPARAGASDVTQQNVPAVLSSVAGGVPGAPTGREWSRTKNKLSAIYCIHFSLSDLASFTLR
jgi:hypothetical protein